MQQHFKIVRDKITIRKIYKGLQLRIEHTHYIHVKYLHNKYIVNPVEHKLVTIKKRIIHSGNSEYFMANSIVICHLITNVLKRNHMNTIDMLLQILRNRDHIF